MLLLLLLRLLLWLHWREGASCQRGLGTSCNLGGRVCCCLSGVARQQQLLLLRWVLLLLLVKQKFLLLLVCNTRARGVADAAAVAAAAAQCTAYERARVRLRCGSVAAGLAKSKLLLQAPSGRRGGGSTAAKRNQMCRFLLLLLRLVLSPVFGDAGANVLTLQQLSFCCL